MYVLFCLSRRSSQRQKSILKLTGPPSGTDILLDSLYVDLAEISDRPALQPVLVENPDFGVNVIKNNNLANGTKGWFGLGTGCTLRVETCPPRTLPPSARSCFQPDHGEPDPCGRFTHATNRTEDWTGTAQMISTEKLKLFSTYQVFAWVRVSSNARRGSQNVRVKLEVTHTDEKEWVNGGEVEATSEKWHEISGSFRFEKQPLKVTVYVFGPDPGVDLLVAGLEIVPVDRKERFAYLKERTDQVHKRDVVLRFSRASSSNFPVTSVKVQQKENSFPFGCCLYRANIDNKDFVDFFLKNFNWAVFSNELKWHHTEPRQGEFNYKDADEMLDFCERNKIQTRDHCIFWEVEGEDPKWIPSLNKNDLLKAVHNRLESLLTRYKGKFCHYNVNNEMLRGSFYQGRLGRGTRADMFKLANKPDPSAVLFLNEGYVDDGCDVRSSPEKYIQQIIDLQYQGAPIGGIGIQGPVGPIVYSALDKLGKLGLPIWLTELEVSAADEHVRADDLEVMIREAFAHPAVERIVLWGFRESYMTDNKNSISHLVNADGKANEAGKHFRDLKQEFLSTAKGYVDENREFKLRGFHGMFTAEIMSVSETITKTFVVEKGESPLEVPVSL